MVSFTMSGDASKLTSTTPLDVKGVSYSYDQKTGCLYDYIRIPGGSEDGGTHTSRDRFVITMCNILFNRELYDSYQN